MSHELDEMAFKCGLVDGGEVEDLKDRIAELTKALMPFASLWVKEDLKHHNAATDDDLSAQVEVKLGDLRVAYETCHIAAKSKR